MEKLKAILVDDRRSHLNRLIKKLANYQNDITIIGGYNNHKEAVKEIINLKPDVLFLDIEIPGTTGFELAAAVKHICSNVIYISGYPEFVSRSYLDNAISFIAKDDLDDPQFIAHAISKLKATIEQQKAKHKIISTSVPCSYGLKEIILKDGHKISISLQNNEKDCSIDILLSVESYRTLSKFISHKYVASAINKDNEFLISHNIQPAVFINLSQAKIRFMNDVAQQLNGSRIELSQEVFFENTVAGGYTLNIDPKSIFFRFKTPNLKLWADIYIQQVIKSRHLKNTYHVEGNQIVII